MFGCCGCQGFFGGIGGCCALLGRWWSSIDKFEGIVIMRDGRRMPLTEGFTTTGFQAAAA